MRAFAHLLALYLSRGRSIHYAVTQASRVFRAGL